MYYPKYVLFNDGVKDITVDMAIEALNYMIKIILSKKPLTNSYKKAITVLQSMKTILNNNTPPHNSKDDLKITIDVIEEVKNSYAKSEEEKRYNAEMAFKCKLIIEMHYWYELYYETLNRRK